MADDARNTVQLLPYVYYTLSRIFQSLPIKNAVCLVKLLVSEILHIIGLLIEKGC